MRMHDVTYEKVNPFREPDWRWERVLDMADRQPTPGRCSRRDDEYIRAARSFLLRWRARADADRRELFYENPGLFLAYQIFEKQQEADERALTLQARLLANMGYKEIARSMDTLHQAVDWYEALFFNVRDKLHARDWVTRQVLVPAMSRGLGLDRAAEEERSPWAAQPIAHPFLDSSLKMFAYFGGPVVCEFMIYCFQAGKRCASPDKLGEWFDEHFSVTAKARSAQAARTFEINKFNVMELFATHLRILEIEKSADSAEHKRTTIEKHVGALLGELEGVWSVGADQEQVEGTGLPAYDAAAAELRDDELLLVAGGDADKRLGALEQLAELELPPPTRKEGTKYGT